MDRVSCTAGGLGTAQEAVITANHDAEGHVGLVASKVVSSPGRR